MYRKQHSFNITLSLLIFLTICFTNMFCINYSEVYANTANSVNLRQDIINATNLSLSNDFLAVLKDNQPQENNEIDIKLLNVEIQNSVITLNFSRELMNYEIGSYQFEKIMKFIHSKIGNELVGKFHNVEFVTQIEGVPLSQLLEKQDKIAIEEVNFDKHAREQVAPQAIQGKIIAISPGHGYYINSSNNWVLQRSYFWGIVEDFVNSDIVVHLYNYLVYAGVDARPTRQLSKNAGIGESLLDKWKEAARYYIKSKGIPSSVWDSSSDHLSDDINTRPLYANYINADLLISIHNNGGGGTGTETWYDTSNGYQVESQRLADILQTKIVSSIREQYDPNWTDRGVKGSNGLYGENRIATRPAVIIEVAFMDRQFPDNAALQDATFQQIVANAIKLGIDEYYGGSEDCIQGYGATENSPSTFEDYLVNLRFVNNCSTNSAIQDVAISFHDTASGNCVQKCYRKGSGYELTPGEYDSIGTQACNVDPATDPDPCSNEELIPGEYLLVYKLKIDDSWKEVAERTVEVIAVTPTAPDLIVQSPSVSDATLEPGQSFTTYATTKNQGTGTSASTTLRFYISTDSTINTSDSQLSTDSVGSLVAGATENDYDIHNAPTAGGTYWVGACVDSVSGESNTGNNCSTGVQVTVATPTAPDLIVQSPSVSDTTLEPSQSFTTYATTKNQGTGTSASTTLRFYISTDSTINTSDSQLSTDSVGSLAAGATENDYDIHNAPTTDGTYWVGACVDSVSGESNTGNNCSTGVQVTVATPTAPDLIVQSPSVSDTTLESSQSFTTYATTRNQGTATSASTTLRFYISTNSTISTSDSQLSTDSVGSLAAGATENDYDIHNAPTTDGTYWVGACVDSVSGESNTGNNCSTGVQVTVATPTAPDLIVQSPSVSDTTLEPGQSFTTYATTKNQGTGTSASTTLRFYISTNSTIFTSDSQLSTDSVGSLAAGATENDYDIHNAPTTDGTYWVGACVDSVSGESNTGNNCSTGVQVTVTDPPSNPINIVPILQLLLLDK